MGKELGSIGCPSVLVAHIKYRANRGCFDWCRSCTGTESMTGDLCESELSRFRSDRGRLMKAYLPGLTEIGTQTVESKRVQKAGTGLERQDCIHTIDTQQMIGPSQA